MTVSRHTEASYIRAVGGLSICERCDKVTFLTRKAARRAARVMKGGNLPRPYPCPHTDGWWHVGHLPQAVRQGEIDRDEYRAKLGGAR